jgi:hypothetical protein
MSPRQTFLFIRPRSGIARRHGSSATEEIADSKSGEAGDWRKNLTEIASVNLEDDPYEHG